MRDKNLYLKEKGDGPNPIDIHVGSRLRQRRTLLGMSQSKLGNAIGLTFQQIQKYERGSNRIGASRLYDLSRVLEVAVGFFFEGLQEKRLLESVAGFAEHATQSPFSSTSDDLMSRRETLELVRAYYRITDPQVRKRIYELAKSLAADTSSRTN